MPVIRPLAAYGKERPCAGIRDRPGQRTAFVKHVVQTPRGRTKHHRTVGDILRLADLIEGASRADLMVP